MSYSVCSDWHHFGGRKWETTRVLSTSRSEVWFFHLTCCPKTNTSSFSFSIHCCWYILATPTLIYIYISQIQQQISLENMEKATQFKKNIWKHEPSFYWSKRNNREAKIKAEVPLIKLPLIWMLNSNFRRNAHFMQDYIDINMDSFTIWRQWKINEKHLIRKGKVSTEKLTWREGLTILHRIEYVDRRNKYGKVTDKRPKKSSKS